MWIALLLGVLAMAIATWLWGGPAHELTIKLGTLMDWARRSNPELYASTLAPITPFVDAKKFAFANITKVLRADLSQFDEISQRLQREARRLDRRAHNSLIPIALYALGFGTWWFLIRG
jgi:hypothetical protein